ncbi:MAG: TonB-dependent receptor, partial [Rhodothermales bacterium]
MHRTLRWMLFLIVLGMSDVRVALGQEQDVRGQHTLSGLITDSESDERLAGATLYVPVLGIGAVADTAGFYSLRLPTGLVVLSVSYLGYRPRTFTLDLRRDLRRDITLVPIALDLEDVEVIAERDEEATSTQMSAITLTAEEVKKLPAFMGEVDVIKAIQLLPGVQSGTEGSTGLYVRGGGPDQNLILLDGAPVYNASHVFGFLSIFNADALADVRLVKGGFPARYGGRLSSVVDIGMKEGNRKAFETDGTVGLVFSSLTAQGPIIRDKASFIVSARRTYIDVLARPFLNKNLPDGQRFVSYFYDMNAKLSATPTRRDRLSLSLYLGRDVYGSTYETVDRSREPVYRQQNTGGADWGNLTATLRWRRLFTSKLFADATLFYSQYNFDVLTRLRQIEESAPPVQQSEEIVYASGIRDLSARIDMGYRPAPTHDVRFGGGLTRHRFNPGVSTLRLRLSDTGGLDTTLTPNAFHFTTTDAFLYAEDDVDLSPRLRANLGLHVSAMHTGGATYASLQPRVAARYLLRPTWSAKASFSTMQQYLHLLTGTGLSLPTDLWLAATDRVGPQRSWQAALGTVYTFGEDRFVASLEGYYKDLRGLIEYEPGASFISPDEDWQDKIEVGRGWSYGAELFLRKKRGRTTGWIGYTLSWAKRRFPSLNDGAAFPYRYDCRHDVSLVLTRELSSRLDVGATWVYGTGQAVTLASARFTDALLASADALVSGQTLPEL